MNLEESLKLAEELQGSSRLALQYIRMLSSACKLGPIVAGIAVPIANQTTNIVTGRANDRTKAFVRITYDMRCYREEPKTEKEMPAIYLMAEYESFYVFNDSFKKQEEKKIGIMLQDISIFNTWIFWREYVQSMTTRMGLPAFPVSLFHPHAEKKVLKKNSPRQIKK